jgi:hypothetical protein
MAVVMPMLTVKTSKAKSTRASTRLIAIPFSVSIPAPPHQRGAQRLVAINGILASIPHPKGQRKSRKALVVKGLTVLAVRALRLFHCMYFSLFLSYLFYELP